MLDNEKKIFKITWSLTVQSVSVWEIRFKDELGRIDSLSA